LVFNNQRLEGFESQQDPTDFREAYGQQIALSLDMKKLTLLLPDGLPTKDEKEFTNEWDKILLPLQKLGFGVSGFSPGINLYDKETGKGDFQIPIYAAKRIVSALSP